MGGPGSGGYKPYKVKPKEHPKILKRIEAGESYKAIGDHYGLTPEAVRKVGLLYGKTSIFKQMHDQRFQRLKPLVLKRLSEVPNVTKVLRELGTDIGAFRKRGIHLWKTKEYLSAKKRLKDAQVCNQCGALLKGKRRWQSKNMCYDCGRVYIAKKVRAYVKHRYHTDPEYRRRYLDRNIQWRLARKKRLSQST
jgi:hypothetical protein